MSRLQCLFKAPWTLNHINRVWHKNKTVFWSAIKLLMHFVFVYKLPYFNCRSGDYRVSSHSPWVFEYRFKFYLSLSQNLRLFMQHCYCFPNHLGRRFAGFYGRLIRLSRFFPKIVDDVLTRKLDWFKFETLFYEFPHSWKMSLVDFDTTAIS